jgi:group I intron endonuclease
MAIIYEIVNLKNNAKYIGSSIRNEIRWRRHITDLNYNRHHSKYLQRAWNKYGKDNFKFNVIRRIENISQEELFEIEQKYLDDRKSNYPSKLNYNTCWFAKGGTVSSQITKETREKMSKSHIGVKFSLERRNDLVDSWTNRSKNEYVLIDPNKNTHRFKNIRKFCREHKLEPVGIGLLLRDKIYFYKGWIKNYSHSYSFISPEGIIFDNIISLTDFCTEHNLRMKGMSKLHRGANKSYYGWKKNVSSFS